MKLALHKYFDKKVLEKVGFRVLDYLLRRTTLNYILKTTITITILEAGAYANSRDMAALFEALKQEVTNRVLYYLIWLGEVLFVKGSLIVLIVCIVITIGVIILRALEISKAHSGEKFKEMQKGLKEKLKKARKSLTVARTEAENEEAEKIEYQKLLDKVSFTLQVKNISKAEIIAKFNKKIRIILLHKNIEDTDLYHIRDEFYPHIGASHIHGGTYIIPPNRIDQNLADGEILEWFEKELKKFIPVDYKYNLSIVSVVDLKSCKTFSHGTEFSKYRFTYLDYLDIEQVLTLREIEAFLYNEKNISSRDIIDVPSLIFLTDKDSVPAQVYEGIDKHNSNIIATLQLRLGMETLKTTDLAQVNAQVLKDSIEEHIDDSHGAENIIIANATFWSGYFDRKK